MSTKIQHAGHNACRICNTHVPHGMNYEFYYGYKKGTSSDQRGATIHYATHYVISGHETIYLCHRCVARKVGQTSIVLSVILAIIIAIGAALLLSGVLEASFLPTTQSRLMAVGIAFVAPVIILALGVIQMIVAAKSSPSKLADFLEFWDKNCATGDQAAIAINEPGLRKSGYNAFFTRAAFQQLK